VILLLDKSCLPAVLAPSEEASITLEEEEEEIKYKADKFKMESHEVSPGSDR